MTRLFDSNYKNLHGGGGGGGQSPNGLHTGIWIKQSGFQPWLGSLHCVFRQDALFS